MKKLLVVLCSILLLLSGCGSSKEEETTIKEEEIIETNDNLKLEDLYGIWTFTNFNIKGSNYTLAEVEALGDYSLSGMYFVFKEGGGAYACSIYNGDNETSTWEYDETTNTVTIGTLEFNIEGKQLVISNDNGSFYLSRYSTSQDITDIPVLEEVDEAEEIEVEEETIVNDDAIRPEIKEAIDSYEAFIDEYCIFMEKYAQDSGNLTLLAQYANMLTKLSDMEEKMDSLEDDLTDAEYCYYSEVLLRCDEKLLKVVY